MIPTVKRAGPFLTLPIFAVISIITGTWHFCLSYEMVHYRKLLAAGTNKDRLPGIGPLYFSVPDLTRDNQSRQEGPLTV
jgi:hypothetical protein